MTEKMLTDKKNYAEFHGGIKPIHIAASNGDAEILNILITEGTKNAKDDYGLSPLHSAVLNGKPEAVEFLIEKDVDINAQDIFGRTPLHLSALTRHSEISQILKDNGADRNIKDFDGYTHFGLFCKDVIDVGYEPKVQLCQDYLSEMESPSETSELISEDSTYGANIEQDHVFV